MKKVIIIGCPGAGKSTFARELKKRTGLPLFYLDMLYHKPDRTTYSKQEFDDKLKNIFAMEEWIIDGNYARTMLVRLAQCDTVFWLDYPLEVCLDGIRSRIGKQREDMPWIEMEKDEEFFAFVENFNTAIRPGIVELIEKATDKKVIVFHSREEAAEFLRTLE